MYPHLFHCGLTPTNPTILIIHLFVGFRGLLCIQEVSFLTASSFSATATSTCSSSSHLNFSAFSFSILSVVICSYSHCLLLLHTLLHSLLIQLPLVYKMLLDVCNHLSIYITQWTGSTLVLWMHCHHVAKLSLSRILVVCNMKIG